MTVVVRSHSLLSLGTIETLIFACSLLSKQVLEGSVNFLRAKLAVEGALRPNPLDNEEQPPSSPGPD